MSKAYLFIFLFCISTFLVSCRTILNKAYGVNEISSINQKKIVDVINSDTILRKYNHFIVDSIYISKIYSSASISNSQKKALLQPLQLLYFDKNKVLISQHANCYVSGFPTLHWNKDNVFNTFPPTSRVTIDSTIDYHSLRQSLIPIQNSSATPTTNNYTVFVFWSYMLYKQSKNMIKTAMENLNPNNVNLYFVNTDLMMNQID